MVLKNRKALKLVVCMSLIVALAISALSLSVWAIYENTHSNSGDQAADIVSVAQTQVGYGEDYSGYTKYGDWYGLPNSDWCAMFVSWCANQAGVDTSVFPSFALCSAGCDWFMSQGRFHYSGTYAPQAGDLIFYASYGNIYHVGLVTGSDGSNVYSIEGNYSDMVSNVSYSLGYGDILGYATPDYSTADGGVVPAVEEGSDEDAYVYEESDDDAVVSEEITDDFEEITDERIIEDSDEETVDSDESEAAESLADDSEEPVTEEDSEEVQIDPETDTSSEENAASDEDLIEMGDVNADSVVDSVDALLVQRYLVLDNSSEIVSLLSADVNASGGIDIGDALAILEMSIGLR